jgi:hypothetical protein
MRIVLAILALMFSSTLVAAQNARTVAPHHASKSSHVKEKLLAANQERISWEASQTWSIPTLREPVSAEHHSIRIDAINQRALDAPKLRREWLKPADEASRLMSEK